MATDTLFFLTSNGSDSFWFFGSLRDEFKAISGKEHPPILTGFQKLSTLSGDGTGTFIFRNHLKQRPAFRLFGQELFRYNGNHNIGRKKESGSGNMLYQIATDLKHKFFRKTGFFRKIRFFEHTETSFFPACKYLFNGELVLLLKTVNALSNSIYRRDFLGEFGMERKSSQYIPLRKTFRLSCFRNFRTPKSARHNSNQP